VLLVSASPSLAASSLTVHFIDVGQGDACLLQLPNGDDILIDAGRPSAGPTVVAYLREQGCDDIELLVATHGDMDHIGGMPAVLEAVPVDEAWLESTHCATDQCQKLYDHLESHNVVSHTVRAGRASRWGEVGIVVLNPSAPLYQDDRNNNSIVLRVTYGSQDILLTGDAEEPAEKRMLAGGRPLSAEILKVGHHGSSSSSSERFLAAVRPQAAIISVGENSYDHPSPEVVSRLEAAGARVWRTDRSGTIVFTVEPDGWEVLPHPYSASVYLPFLARESRLESAGSGWAQASRQGVLAARQQVA